MSQPHPTFSYLLTMEGDIADIERWSDVLYTLGSSQDHLEPGTIKVIAGPLAELGRRLDASWKKACKVAGGDV